ncbi:MAG: hypothetical protein ABR540_20740, partial [Acidimicrobiales bacterium]
EGTLVIDHYAYNVSRFTKSAPLFRAYLRRVSPEDSLRRTEQLVRRLMPLHERTRASRLAHVVLSRISPVAYYGHTYPELDPLLLREWALLDTHDSLTDRYKHLRTRRQILATLKALGLDDMYCDYGGNGIEARGRRP